MAEERFISQDEMLEAQAEPISLSRMSDSTSDATAHYIEHVRRYLIEKYGFVKYAFADPVKQICKILFDFSDDQLYGNKKEGVDFRWYLTPRDAFQKIGTEFAQNDIYNYFPRLKERLKDEVIWVKLFKLWHEKNKDCLLYTSPSPRDAS